MRKNEREERHRASSGSHSIAAWNSGAGPCWKQELGTQRRIPTWVAGMQGPEPSPAGLWMCFRDKLFLCVDV